MPRLKIPVGKEELETLYLKKFLALDKIASHFNCNRETIRNRLKDFGIPKKSSSAARMRYKKFNFSGDKTEKAYLIGFRLGDLNVYRTSKDSELIVARCNTTQSVQIQLMRQLFDKYGKVTISKGHYSTNINCYLNTSFDFLLPKYTNVSPLIGEDNEAGAAFIAGYTDAEGNFLLNQAKARFKIDSYDVEILEWITNWLKNQGVRVKFRQIGKEGGLRSNGTRFKHDLWRLNVNETMSLLKFIRMIKSFSKHPNRLRHMEVCEENIKKRIATKTVKING